MNPMRFLTLLLLGSLSTCLADDVVLSNFNNQTMPFPYGSWVNESTSATMLIPEPDGLSVADGATTEGGACVRDVNFSFSDDQVIELEVTVLEGNQAQALNVLLENADGTQAGWRFDLSGVPAGETRTLISSPISKPYFTTPQGETFDPTSVISWHVQGDFSGEDLVRVRLENLVVKSPAK